MRACRAVRSDLSLPSGADIVSDEGGAALFCLLKQGLAYRYIVGRRCRQIIDVLLPGDFIGLSLSNGSRRCHPVRSLTQIEVAPLDQGAFATLIWRRPALAALLLQLQLDAEYRAELRMMVLGRQRPTARLCYAILDLRERLLERGAPAEEAFWFPMTYRLLGDLIGASRSQTAASLVELRERGWATIKGGRVAVHDLPRMIAACGYVPADRCDHASADWVPRRAAFGVSCDNPAPIAGSNISC